MFPEMEKSGDWLKVNRNGESFLPEIRRRSDVPAEGSTRGFSFSELRHFREEKGCFSLETSTQRLRSRWIFWKRNEHCERYTKSREEYRWVEFTSRIFSRIFYPPCIRNILFYFLKTISVIFAFFPPFPIVNTLASILQGSLEVFVFLFGFQWERNSVYETRAWSRIKWDMRLKIDSLCVFNGLWELLNVGE